MDVKALAARLRQVLPTAGAAVLALLLALSAAPKAARAVNPATDSGPAATAPAGASASAPADQDAQPVTRVYDIPELAASIVRLEYDEPPVGLGWRDHTAPAEYSFVGRVEAVQTMQAFAGRAVVADVDPGFVVSAKVLRAGLSDPRTADEAPAEGTAVRYAIHSPAKTFPETDQPVGKTFRFTIRVEYRDNGRTVQRRTLKAEAASAVKELLAVIREHIDPPSWERGMKLSERNGQLTVTQTPANQAEVAKLLETIRQSSSQQFLVEVRVLQCSRYERAKVWKAVGDDKLWGDEEPGGYKAAGLDEKQQEKLLVLFKSFKYGRLLSAPRLTVWNAERAWVHVGDLLEPSWGLKAEMVPLPIQGREGKTAAMRFQPGILLDVEVWMNREAPAVTLRPELARLDRQAGKGLHAVVSKPERLTLGLAKGGAAALVELPLKAWTVTGLAEVGEAAGGARRFDIVQQPAPDHPLPAVFIMVWVTRLPAEKP